MNRERAETFLRLLAEAELRDPPPPPLHAGGATDAPFFTVPASLSRAAWALTAVRALQEETADDILADVELALALRQQYQPTDPARPNPVGSDWLSRLTAPHQRSWRFSWPSAGISPPRRSPGLAPGGPAARPRRAGASSPATGSPAACPDAPDRYVPLGLTIAFHDEAISGELDLLSYAHTASGARLTGIWRTRDRLGSRHELPPVEAFAVTDDRGARYDLGFNFRSRPQSTCNLILLQDPPDDIRWLDVTAPGEQAVRVDLEPEPPRSAEYAEPEISQTGLSAGEHLLTKIAEQLLTTASHFPRDLRLLRPARSPGPLAGQAAGLGAVVAALEAAEVLSPLSPVPGQLAALCASLLIGGHGITAPPAHDLPEPWLSLLAHYHRRKPDPAPIRDGFAAVATALPEVDGIRLILLGLLHADGDTWMHALAIGQMPDHQHARLNLDVTFPLSVWIRDGSGRWHAARTDSWSGDDGERALTLRLVPPLTRPTPCLEVLAAGRSAEVRAMLPLCWRYPP